jgi:dienelactone hydrolase
MQNKMALFIICILISINVYAGVVTKEVTYRQGDTVMKGLIAYDNEIEGKRPGILVVHEWWGHNSYARSRAKQLAALGYTALAVDMYGDGKTADHPDDAGKFSSAVGGNLPLAKARFDSAIEKLKSQSSVDPNKLAAIGYCFGGGIVINMARMGTELDGVVSFHGSIATKSPVKEGDVKTKIRAFNGADDPFVTAEQIEAFETEMSNAGVDYKFVNYPDVKHSFTNPDANKFGKQFNLPLEYNKKADEDSWEAMKKFFVEIFEN